MRVYSTITSWDRDEFDRKVNAALKDGWELQGGVSTCIQENSNFYYTQAMTRTSKPEAKP